LRNIVIARNNSRAKILLDGIGSIGIKAVYFALQFVVGVLLARTLGPKALGIYAFTMALIHVAVILAQFGFPASLVRTIAVGLVAGERVNIRSHIQSVGFMVLAMSLSIIAALGIYLLTMGSIFDRQTEKALMAGLPLIALLALTATASGAIRGLGYVVKGQLADEIIRPLVLCITLAMFWVSGKTLTPQLAMLAHTVAAALALTVAWGLVLKLTWSPPHASIRMIRTDQLRQSLPFLLLAGAQVLNYQADVLMLGILTEQQDVGQYRVALQIVEGLGVTLFALSVVIAPRLAQFHAKQDWVRLQRLLVYSHRVGAVTMLPLGLGVAAFGAPLIELVFGSAYVPAAGALAILALAKILYATVGFAGLALSMLGRAGMATVVTLATFVMNVGLNLILIPRYGIEGAAIATGVSHLIVNTGGLVWMRRALSHNFSAFAWIR
jgi:O-antigen/teichoic acid export membrane protein